MVKLGNHHHEDERYKNYYDRTPHGEIPSDERMREAVQDGTDPVEDSDADSASRMRLFLKSNKNYVGPSQNPQSGSQ